MRWFRKPSSTPLWRDEFPVFTADERYVSRRQFTKFLTLTSFGMFVGNLWIYAKSLLYRAPVYPRVPVAQLGEIPVGGVKTFAYPAANDPCLMVRTGDDTYVAYSQKCTHLSCAVYYEKETNCIKCPCHQGYFAVADGSVISGPPPRPLPKVVLERNAGELIAVRMEGEGA
jgi:nitrite reductase/ring-hydroxylating ferredoxin subunit